MEHTTKTNSNGNTVILVVDDDRTTLLMLRNVLHKEGYQVLEVNNGEEALDVFTVFPPDLVLMDINMPVMDGLTACARLKKLPGGDKTPVLIFTGLEDEQSVEEAFDAGAQDFVTKPINWRELRYRIRRMLYLREMEDAVNYQAYYDTLTDLPNRLLFSDRLSVSLGNAEQKEEMLAVLLLNLRDFKLINDAFGYDAGDVLLQKVAERLKTFTSENTSVARLSGNHFALALSEIKSEENIVTIADKVVDDIGNRPWTLDEQTVNVPCNIGISFYPHDGTDVQTLLKKAETAMYRAADDSFNSSRFYNQQMNRKARERLTMENRLREAIRKKEFIIYYQPLVQVETGSITGAEALLRWKDPERGMVSPADFIPLAEETELIVPIGEMVLQEVCVQGYKWQNKSKTPVSIGVNLSALQFQQKNLEPLILSILEQTGMPPECLKLEITESTALRDLDYTFDILQRLKEHGIRVSIDDFGTGYSSLNYIKRLPVDELKIDASFIRDAASNKADRVIVETILFLGRGLELNIVAEGVENEEQIQLLKKGKCNEFQGFYFSPPLPMKDWGPLLEPGFAYKT